MPSGSAHVVTDVMLSFFMAEDRLVVDRGKGLGVMARGKGG